MWTPAAGRVTAVVPYFGYARADKRHARREPITASLVAKLFQAVGLNHLVTLKARMTVHGLAELELA